MDEDSRVESDDNSSMWLMLTTAVTEVVGSIKFEELLSKIGSTLSFDDPGLFSTKLKSPPDKKLAEEVCNTWFFNQVLYSLSTSQNNKGFIKASMELHEVLLSASLLKQPSIFKRIIKEYIKLSRVLATLEVTGASRPVEVEVFFHHENFIKDLDKKAKYHKIKISQNENRDFLLEQVLKILTFGMTIAFDLHEDLCGECTDSVVNAYNFGNLKIKVLCIAYVSKLASLTDEVTSQIIAAIESITKGMRSTVEKLLLWLEFDIVKKDDVIELGKEVKNFLKITSCLRFPEKFHEKLQQILTDWTNILSIVYSKKRKSIHAYFYSSDSTVVKFFINLITQVDIKQLSKDEFIKLSDILPECPEICRILELFILEEATDVKVASNLYEGSETWQRIHEILVNSLEICTSDNNTTFDETFTQYIRLIGEIFKSLNNIENNYQVWHQFEHLNQPTCKICLANISGYQKTFLDDSQIEIIPLKFFQDSTNIVTLIKNIVEKVSSKSNVSFQHFCFMIDIAGQILQNRICIELPSDIQIALINIIGQSLRSTFGISCETVIQLIDDILPSLEDSFQKRCVTLFVNIEIDHLSQEVRAYYKGLIEQLIVNPDKFGPLLQDSFFNLIISRVLPFSIVKKHLITPSLNKTPLPQIISQNIKQLVCSLSGNVFMFKIREEFSYSYKIICRDCDVQNICVCPEKNSNEEFRKELLSKNKGVFIHVKKNSAAIEFQRDFSIVFSALSNKKNSTDLIRAIPSLLLHLNLLEDEQIQENWIKLLSDKTEHIRLAFSKQFSPIVRQILAKPKTVQEPLLQKCTRGLLDSVKDCLETSNKEYQSHVVNMIRQFGSIEEISEDVLQQLFKMTFFFFIRYESCVAHQAALCAEEICLKHKVTPKQMLNWYKQDTLKLIITLCVSTYLRNGVSLYNSLSNITKMLGFMGTTDFVRQHQKLLVAILLPWCIKYPKCMELLEEVAGFVQRRISALLSFAFLTVYPYLFLNESTEISAKCIDFVVDNTGSSLYTLLHSDIKRTVAEILIYYHKNPENVIKAFRCLLPRDVVGSQGSSEIPHGKMAEYIATRFLGVLTHFEAVLTNPDCEKNLKKETMLSLGEIIRFIGPKDITPFRFKILAMLRTAQMVEGVDLKPICAQVWRIFIKVVDIQALGPLLSTIVASMEPLLESHPEEINSMYKFLILSNGSLLSLHIPDLYFIENYSVDEEIKNFVTTQTEKIWKGDNFMDKFKFFVVQIKQENLAVRTYALKYLTELFKTNRQNLNKLVIGQNSIHPMLESVLNDLMASCRHADKNLQLTAGKCLGEIGAIEPSHLPPNYAPQKDFALDIHSDSFAIMALQELCRAYQFQKDTKFVDSFSLAIQEILSERGVMLRSKKKQEVWEVLPQWMRELMEPLLNSCYTVLKSNDNVKIHPVFGSAKSISPLEWAYFWSSKMINNIEEDETNHLLSSFRPSIRRDLSTLSLLLPYVVLHSVQSSVAEDIDKIFEELQCVFEAAVKDGNVFNINTNRPRGIKTLQFVASEKAKKQEELTEFIGVQCAKIGFDILDFLERWLREWSIIYIGHTPDSKYLKVESFLKRFDHQIIAQSNFCCGEYARALRYLEAYIEADKPGRLQESLSFLAEIYAELMDCDSLEGAMGMKNIDLTLSEQILVNNMTDRLLESTACFEKVMQSENISSNNVKDIVQCYLLLDTPETALLISEGLLNRLGEKYMDDSLKEIQAEPLWRLSRFDELDKLLQNPFVNESTNWGVQCGQALVSYRKNDNEFGLTIEKIRLNILDLLKSGGNEQNLYHKGYPHMMKLHLISEIENTKTVFMNLSTNSSERDCIQILNNFFKDWNSRLDILQPTPRIAEPVLCLRRILLDETKKLIVSSQKTPVTIQKLSKILEDEIGNMWIKSSEITRKAGWYQQAQLCIMNAEQYEPETLFIEKAKLLWKKGDQTNSFKVIEQKIKEIEDVLDNKQLNSLPDSTRILYAEAKFLQASYNAESMNISSDLNIRFFKESLKGNQKSEKCFVHLAQYIDRVYASLSEVEQQNHQGREMLLEIMVYYGKSMFFGCKYIYQSMPRMLSIWLDFTAQMKKDEHFRKVGNKMNEVVEKFSETVPLFIFFTAFSQLVSRICHPSNEVYGVFKSIIIRLILKFPQQSLWMLLYVCKSSYANRRKRCSEIFQDKRLGQTEMQKLILDFNVLAEKLIELTNKEIPGGQTKPTVSSLVKSLPKLFADPSFSKIVMPFQQFMQPVLPPTDERSSPVNHFNAFPNRCVYIKGIKEEITILMSLQKPRKVALIGSDGKEYFVMMKPKDDLRKDFRLMEFNAVVKQYLHQDPDARQRRLSIRTYAVLPLNEECGLIEWVHNLNAFRQILLGFYKQRKQAMTAKELKGIACANHDPMEKKLDVFLNTLIPRHPPVFAEWFKQRFTTPHNWYQARSSYIRTSAVMSMVGYILGLGDRHGENILFDGTNGDTVHVDFNCLFNKGESFDFPEKVPFRLTHNMVHAMGPLGVEGLFRKCCEITMRVLQTQTPTLMSVLRPFVYDPLVTWNRQNRASDGSTERTDSQAMANVKHIEERLKGFVKIKGRTSNMPLSTEGQVNHIITEATNIENLASMYIGWGSFM